MVKNLPIMQESQETPIQSLGWENPLEEAWHPILYSCLGNARDSEPDGLHPPHSLKESDTAEATERMQCLKLKV